MAAWGLMDSVFSPKARAAGAAAAADAMLGEYLSEPIARRMMADQPELRKQFEPKLAADPKFAADSRARMAWWFEKSKYEPEENGRYPIVRVWDPIAVR